jgi:uncharacterized membrane protein YdjX (TVP38/TMEM64 family)
MYVKRVLPVVGLVAVMVTFFVFDLQHWFTLDALTLHHHQLQQFQTNHAVIAPLVYVLLYIGVVAFSLPGGTLMTLVGGFLFGAWQGSLLTVVAATTGASLLFLLAKTTWGDVLIKKVGPSLRQMQQGFADNALSYMFVLRLVPVIPFFLVNLAPAFLGVSLRVYVIATFFGIMPATFVFSLAGSGFGQILEQGGMLTLQGILTPHIVAALFGLAGLALMPVFYRRYFQKN